VYDTAGQHLTTYGGSEGVGDTRNVRFNETFYLTFFVRPDGLILARPQGGRWSLYSPAGKLLRGHIMDKWVINTVNLGYDVYSFDKQSRQILHWRDVGR